MTRVLLLTSCVGLIARHSCHAKILTAQLIASAFLVLFLWARPYRRASHRAHTAAPTAVCALA